MPSVLVHKISTNLHLFVYFIQRFRFWVKLN